MRTLIATTLALLATPALAADHEVSLEAGVFDNGSESFERFSDTRALPTWGLRGGYSLGEHVGLIGTLHHGRRGARVDVITADGGGTGAVYRAAYDLTELSVGAKVDTLWRDRFAPYALGSLVGVLGVMRLDDDASTRLNPGQIRSTGVSLGARAVGGMEVRFAPEQKVHPALHLEVGWAGVLPHGYRTDDADGEPVRIGRMGWSGVVVRGGAGVRF